MYGLMEERRLRVLALLLVAVGFGVLGVYAWLFQDGSNIEDVKGQDLASLEGTRLSITGSVVGVQKHGKVQFLRLSPAPQVPIVSFQDLNVEEKSMVKVSGKVKMYKGSPELVVEKVTRVS